MSQDQTPPDGRSIVASLVSIIPEDTSTGIFKTKLGLTPAEAALVAAPIIIEVFVILSFFNPARWQFFLVIGTFAGIYTLVLRAEFSPRELVARNLGSLREQFRMPLLGSAAWSLPGIVDIHPGHDAVERRDGAQVALIRVEPSNESQAGADERARRAFELAQTLDTKLSKTNTPAKVWISRRTPTPADQVDGLDTAARDGLTHRVGERAVAVDRANAAVAELAEEGAMEQDVIVATWVHPDALSSGSKTYLDELAHTSLARPSDSAREAQMDALNRRVRNVHQVCQTVGRSHQLDTDGIVTVLRRYWQHRDDAGAFSERAHGESTGGLLGRLAASAPGFTAAFAPDWLNAHSRHAEVDEMYTSSFWVSGWPKYPDPGFLDPLLESDIECDISVFIGPANRQRKMAELGDRIDRAGGQGSDHADQGDESGAEDAAQHAVDLGSLRSHMRDDGVDASEVSLYVTIRAEDLDTLTDHRADLQEAATEAELDISLAAGRSRQAQGLVTTSPTGGDRLFEAMRGYLDRFAARGGLVADLVGVHTGTRTRTDMPPGAISSMSLFARGVVEHHNGVLHGLARSTSGHALGALQVARDRLTSPHRFFVGRSGSGKTFREIVLIVEELIRHPERRVVILDIARNFDGVIKLFGGEKIVLGETTLNPFAVSEGVNLDDHISILTNMFQIYLRHNAEDGMAKTLRPTVSTAVRRTYERVGIEDGSDAGKPSPTMHTFHDVLADMHDNAAEYTVRETDAEVEEVREHAGLLLSRFKPFTEGGSYSYLVADPDDPDGAANPNARAVLYDMHLKQDSEGAEKGMLAMLVLALSFNTATATDELITVVVDEAHKMFLDAQQAGRFESTVRAGRNAGLCFDFLSQADEDFDESTARIIAKQCSLSTWGDLGEIDPETPLRFGWSHSQAATINGQLETGDNPATDYAEAMVDVEGDRYRTEFRVGPVCHAIATYREHEDGPWEPYLEAALDEAAAQERELRGGEGETEIEARTPEVSA